MYKIGDTVEGRYKIVDGDYKSRKYTLVNVFNKRVLTICYERMLDIFNGKTTLSKVIYNKAQIKRANFYHRKHKFCFYNKWKGTLYDKKTSRN